MGLRARAAIRWDGILGVGKMEGKERHPDSIIRSIYIYMKDFIFILSIIDQRSHKCLLK
jgi:hypothetical protein